MCIRDRVEAERKVGGEPRDVRLLGAFLIPNFSLLFSDKLRHGIRGLG